jgi:hypothetical protein
MRDKDVPKAVIWTDNLYGTVGGAYWAIAEDGTRLEWTINSEDGKQGSVVISGQSYDIRKGNVFLVWTREVPVKVSQLARDLSGAGNVLAGKVLTELAEQDDEISKFIATAAARK